MAIQCKYCGTDLPRDDARFCNNCGMLVPSHPFSPQSLSILKSDSKLSLPSSSHDQQLHTPAIQEEAVLEKLPATQQPVNRASTPTEPPVKQESTPLRPRPFQIPQQSPAWPLPVTHVSMKEAPAENREAGRKPIPPTPPLGDVTPAHKIQVSEPLPEENKSTIDPSVQPAAEEQHIEELPTTELAVPVEEHPTHEATKTIEELPTTELAVPVEEPPTHAATETIEELPTSALAVPVEEQPTNEVATPIEEPDETSMAIEELPTKQVAAIKGGQLPAQKQPIEALPMNAPAVRPSAQPLAKEEPTPRTADPINFHKSMNEHTEAAAPSAFPAPSISTRSTTLQEAPPFMPSRPKRSLRMPILIAALLLVVLISAGVVAWINIYQPFSVAPITQPEVGFSDAQLGISLLYPNGWIKQSTTGAIHFYTSNHTADIDILVTTSSSVSQSLQQQASKLGISGAKAGASLSFADATWQQLQGTVQQSGANYTNTLLGTMHGGHLFIVMQQAPQNNYTDWEKEFFEPTRTSLKFL